MVKNVRKQIITSFKSRTNKQQVTVFHLMVFESVTYLDVVGETFLFSPNEKSINFTFWKIWWNKIYYTFKRHDCIFNVFVSILFYFYLSNVFPCLDMTMSVMYHCQRNVKKSWLHLCCLISQIGNFFVTILLCYDLYTCNQLWNLQKVIIMYVGLKYISFLKCYADSYPHHLKHCICNEFSIP